MDKLAHALVEVQNAGGSSPAVLRLCLDCWEYGQVHGEEAGVSYAAMLLDGVMGYVAYHAARQGVNLTGFGPVLGELSPPPSCWVMGWETLKTKDRPMMKWLDPDTPVPPWARYWADGGKGWYRIPRGEEE